MLLLVWSVGGVAEDARRFAAGFLQVLPLAVPAWDSDPAHTDRPGRLLGEAELYYSSFTLSGLREKNFFDCLSERAMFFCNHFLSWWVWPLHG